MTGLKASVREALILVLCGYLGFAGLAFLAYAVGVVL